MIIRIAKLSVWLLFLQALLPVHAALADTGPKPSMEFEFNQEMAGEPVTITAGIMYECEQPDCSDASPLQELGPQRFSCETNSCYAMAYGFSAYHRLELQFSDGQTRRSNVFETAGFDSRYTVTIRPEDLQVDGQLSLPAPRTVSILAACLCGVVALGLLVGLVLLRRSRGTGRQTA